MVYIVPEHHGVICRIIWSFIYLTMGKVLKRQGRNGSDSTGAEMGDTAEEEEKKGKNHKFPCGKFAN